MIRKFILFSALALVIWLPDALAQSQTQTADSQQTSASVPQSSTAQPAPGSLADAARKAREQKKESKPAKVFTNDDLPKSGGISTVGTSGGTSPSDQNATSASITSTSAPKGEKEWRARFADLHHKLEQDQAALDVAQREANVDATQFYGGDPEKSYKDQTSQQPLGQDYNKKVAEVDAKKKQIADDQQAIDDAEDDLRKSGGDPGWAR